MDARIDYSRFTKPADKGQATQAPSVVEHVRSQTEVESKPGYFQKQKEQEGRSEWSGGNWGGRGRW